MNNKLLIPFKRADPPLNASHQLDVPAFTIIAVLAFEGQLAPLGIPHLLHHSIRLRTRISPCLLQI